MSLGNLIGKFEKVDSDEKGRCWGGSLRIQVLIDTVKPSKRGNLIKLTSMAKERWIPNTYEELLDFCCGCGCLGHTIKDCLVQIEEDKVEPRFSPELREQRLIQKKNQETQGFGAEKPSPRTG